MSTRSFAMLTLALAVVTATLTLSKGAAATQKLSPKPLPAEVPFVSAIAADLPARFATAAAAEAAGYFRYTNEDKTGAISYANLQWQSSDGAHPSQLWYDVNGNLLGADFSVLTGDSTTPPSLWGIDPRRWIHLPAHVHFVLAGAHGPVYGGSYAKPFIAAGGNLSAPSADTLVKLGIVKNTSEVRRIFEFPSIWDLIVWVKPNPNGAFADFNPLVHPTANAGKDM